MESSNPAPSLSSSSHAQLPARISSLLPASFSRISSLLEVSGLLRGAPQELGPMNRDRDESGGAEVSIRIIADSGSPRESGSGRPRAADSTVQDEQSGSDRELETEESTTIATAAGDREAVRYDFQHLAKWVEQILPFSILLLVVFIRQHLQGFLVTLWISAIMIKANSLLRKQTSLRGERKTYILVVLAAFLIQHVEGIYWWYRADALWRPLVLLPPKDIPNFADAFFNIVLNDTMVRLSAMAFKCGVLIYYKKGRGRNYRWQGQILTLTEYVVLLYRTVIPGPVWYRFFLNKEYGSLFSSLTTGLYLTFKVTSVLEKVQKFATAVRSILRREVQYGTYATHEEVLAVGDLCAICQEKMHAPISLLCKHVFCEDCVSEWFERERTCPLCRSVVKSSELRSFGDGSTSLFVQLF
ncbi:hypothetical protein SELMODRAFT_269003 [Selaginella moellendorffii]|uniref:RING-type domain-containing protein n=1 Tax=Selaginella moellendorffii TaxID=88036 RepID=D8SQ50_SELML|nr:E3 ubiquitin-protein ligase RNFT1 [Selaginella moellendorffii]EFJ13527.1 hypothetical protein SELMODRAFT_269003 [Selaginella moellendorffii]|eukprot:XP_002985397.1 E3 ubiquitin-protein ligase RNFT1 [Selaginella moellendorffii]